MPRPCGVLQQNNVRRIYALDHLFLHAHTDTQDYGTNLLSLSPWPRLPFDWSEQLQVPDRAPC